MAIRDFIRSFVPVFLLERFRARKKEKVRKALEEQRKSGKILRKEDLVAQLKAMGIQPGDTLLVHSSLSKIGYVENGAQTVIDALLESVGATGNILMPTSPNAGLQLDYVRHLDCFDILNSPSKLGIISETFRKLEGAKRSVSATEPVSCSGPGCEALTKGHAGQLTPYNAHSPFYKVAEANGKILYIGVTLANAGTSLHLLEDAVEAFRFPVYYPELLEVKIRDEEGKVSVQTIKVHNPEWSAKRRCDELIPVFADHGVLQHVQLGNAPTLLVDAAGMLRVMIELYEKEGVTMYTPEGSNNVNPIFY